MNAVSLRLVYILEFLIAMPAIYTTWSQVGGQGHLDLMPWYWKLLLGAGAALAIVGVTAAMIGQERLWTLRSVSWMMLVLIFAVGMGLVTLYYHLHEGGDEGDSEETTTAAVLKTAAGTRCCESRPL